MARGGGPAKGRSAGGHEGRRPDGRRPVADRRAASDRWRRRRHPPEAGSSTCCPRCARAAGRSSGTSFRLAPAAGAGPRVHAQRCIVTSFLLGLGRPAASGHAVSRVVAVSARPPSGGQAFDKRLVGRVVAVSACGAGAPPAVAAAVVVSSPRQGRWFCLFLMAAPTWGGKGKRHQASGCIKGRPYRGRPPPQGGRPQMRSAMIRCD